MTGQLALQFDWYQQPISEPDIPIPEVIIDKYIEKYGKENNNN